MENFDEEVNSTGNNGQSESSSFSVSTRISFNNSVFSSYDEEDQVVYPEVPEELIPVKGAVFDSLEKCIQMYERYAYHSGFDVRKSTQKKLQSGKVKERYLLCNKAGNTRDVTSDTTSVEKRQRTSSIHVTGCKARAIFKIDDLGESYVLDIFEPRHNHEMVPKEHRHLLRKSRQLGLAEMNFIHRVSTSNIGATKAHNLYSNIQGSYKKTHGTVTDFKNHKTAIDCYIGLDDSQMLINKMENTLKCVRGFSFNYKVEDKHLAGLFWADETAKLNYMEFGDIISFDATYRTNKYNLIFVPFTAIDNHKKTVSIGAGMLHNEKSDSYKWLLEKFLEAFGSQPKMVVTDQDLAMKKAIEDVLPESRHRLCMWHITQKLPSKVGNDMFEHTDFKKKFNDIVWNLSIDANTFEEKWFEIMKEFGLEDHEWFTYMYSIRSTWIPAYFRDMYMSGLMRTTSRSESENSFFSNFMNQKSTLVHFMMSYESAMEKQGSRLEFLDHQSLIKTARFSTRLEIEKQACNVYTRAIFLLVQKEIQISIYDCAQISVNSEEGVDVILIRETKEMHKRTGKSVEEEKSKKKRKKKGVEEDEEVVEDIRTVEGEESENTNRALFSKQQENSASTSTNERVKKSFIFKLIHNSADQTVVCSCKTFERYGFLCRHIFCMFKANNIEQIPEKYIIRRWRKDLIPPGMRTRRTRYGESNEEFERLTTEAQYIVENCMTLLRNDEDLLSAFVDKVRSLKGEIEDGFTNAGIQNKDKIIESFLGVTKPAERQVENPEVEGYKGCGSRLKSSKEIAMEQTMKHKRKCANCGKMTFHDKRNCAKKTKEEEEKKAKAEALKASKKK